MRIPTVMLSLFLLSVIFMIKLAQSQPTGNTTNAVFQTNTVCIKKGRLLHGAVTSLAINASTVQQLRIGHYCGYNSLAVDVGAIVNQVQLTSGGLCLTNVAVLFGIVQVLDGDVVSPGGILDPVTNKTCSPQSQDIITVSLNNNNTLLQILPSNTPLRTLLTVEEDPLLAKIDYTLIKLTEKVCLEGGILIDGLILKFDSTSPLTPQASFNSCLVDTVLVEPGVRSSPVLATLATAICLTKGQIFQGRVLIQANSTVRVNQTLSNGKTCTENGQNGVVAQPGVYLLVPRPKPVTPKYTRPSYTQRPSYNRDPEPYKQREPSYEEYPRRPYEYDDYLPPRQEERRRNDRNKPKRVDKKRQSRLQIKEDIDDLADLIADRISSKLAKRQRSKNYWDKY